MSESVVIYTENETDDHGLKTILEFLGHEVFVVASKEELETFFGSPPGDLLTLVIARPLEEGEQKALADMVEKNAPHVLPVVLFEPPAEGEPPILLNYPRDWPLVQLPLNQEQLLQALEQARKKHRPPAEKEGRRPPHLFRSLIGSSAAIQRIRNEIYQVAPTEANVLIMGESGTGKEVTARNIHYYSKRRGKPFVPVNCGAIPKDLLESELFGHEKGAFTGALTAREGRFAMAEGGTLFLDEIGEMPMEMQVKLLRVLEDRTYERVGGNRQLKADVRIVAATNRNLEEMVREGKFREDLFYRLEVFPIILPPLRERVEDLPLLIVQLNERMENEKNCGVHLSPEAIAVLSRYDWPGNVRELANLMERLAIQFPHGLVQVKDLPAKYRSGVVVEEGVEAELVQESSFAAVMGTDCVPHIPPGGLDLKSYISELEQSLIKEALEESGGVVAHAAKLLGLRRTTLAEKMRKYGLNR